MGATTRIMVARWCARAALVLLLGAVGCLEAPSIEDRPFACTDDTECAAGWLCHPTQGVCVPQGTPLDDASTTPSDAGTDTMASGDTTDTISTDTEPEHVTIPELCGNGKKDPNEWCDTGIAPGEEGACPSECPPSSTPCKASYLIYVADDLCQNHCEEGDVTTTVHDDGCCYPSQDDPDSDDCVLVDAMQLETLAEAPAISALAFDTTTGTTVLVKDGDPTDILPSAKHAWAIAYDLDTAAAVNPYKGVGLVQLGRSHGVAPTIAVNTFHGGSDALAYLASWTEEDGWLLEVFALDEFAVVGATARWSAESGVAGVSVTAPPAVDELGNAFVPLSNGTVAVLSGSDTGGATLASRLMCTLVLSGAASPSVTPAIGPWPYVVVGDTGGGVSFFGLDGCAGGVDVEPTTSAPSSVGGPVEGIALAAQGGDLVVMAAGGSDLAALRTSGEVLGTKSLSGAVLAGPVTSSYFVYVAVDTGATSSIQAHDLLLGEASLKYDMSLEATAVALEVTADDTLLVTASTGTDAALVTIFTQFGEQRWTFPVDHAVVGPPLLLDTGALAVQSANGTMTVISTTLVPFAGPDAWPRYNKAPSMRACHQSGPTCTDACTSGAEGCLVLAPNADGVWTCSAGIDDDPCLDLQVTACESGKQCDAALCQ